MKHPTAQPWQITELRLANWRNFSRVDVALGSRVFLVGPNAAGKSNLLDAFWFLHDVVTAGGGFQEAVRRRRGVDSLRCLTAGPIEAIRIAVKIGRLDQPPAWEYELAFSQRRRQPLVITSERVVRSGRKLRQRPDAADRADPQRLAASCLEPGSRRASMEELGKFFAAIDYLHIVPQLVRRPTRSPERRHVSTGDPYGQDFLQQVARTPERTRAKRLKLIGEALRVSIPQLCRLEFWRDGHGAPHLRWRCEHWRAAAAWQTEEEFSDGTLRLLGLLWATLHGGGPLLLEEPELSLHPDVARYVPQMLARMQQRSGRQILVSTHSTEMLSDEGIGLDELLVLQPGLTGTSVRLANEFPEIRALLRGGASLSEAAFPHTRPPNAEQLSLFPR